MAMRTTRKRHSSKEEQGRGEGETNGEKAPGHMDNRKVATTGTGFRDPRANEPRRKVPVSTFSDKPMWDIHDIQDGDIHGEGLQNRIESQVGKDQMGGESEKGIKRRAKRRWRDGGRGAE